MNDEKLQQLTETISENVFGKTFNHKALFNKRLRTTGGRYMLRSHNIEINPAYYEEHGMDELIGIIKHELCHYHLHIEGKGHQHRDEDFRKLLKETGSPRHCTPLKSRVMQRKQAMHLYECSGCGQKYNRKRRVNVQRYVCGKCAGKLVKKG
ncbi:SprT family protein [Falsibacillus pallidus]|uniref:Protein SprT-like n=1 Tax=Falsibacillus pallidus TaxID=493781 RepID=A0A370G9K4_9BACI|nr:SprT family protein [Falsibacillus pallidus]RDI39856.1 SprT-like protein [Falsibacillus pallidus]